MKTQLLQVLSDLCDAESRLDETCDPAECIAQGHLLSAIASIQLAADLLNINWRAPNGEGPTLGVLVDRKS